MDQDELDKAAARLQDRSWRALRDHALALIARLRLARVQVAQNKPDEALATLDAVDPGGFALRYHEVRGDAFAAKKDPPSALKEYRAARAADAERLRRSADGST